ncbi:hypothetical protein BsWGS_23165 [Bradybaena similaris]
MNDYRKPTIFCRDHETAVLVDDYKTGDVICPECALVVGDRFLCCDDMTDEPNDEDDYKYCNGRVRAAYLDLAEMAERLNAPQILLDISWRLYKDVHKLTPLRTYSRNTLMATCMYIACRQEGVPRTIKEICGVTDVSSQDMKNAITISTKYLEIRLPAQTPEDYMDRFCCKLQLSNATQKGARYIATKAGEISLVFSSSPITVAAAAIYMAAFASGETKKTEEISDISGILPHAIKKVYMEIRPYAAALFPADFKFSSPVEKLPKH